MLSLVDSKGRIFSHSNAGKINESNYINTYFKDIYNSEEGFTAETINGKNMSISWLKSSVNDWWYVSVTPLENLNKNILLVKQFSLLFLALIILFSLVSVNYITVKIFKPFNVFISAISKKFNIINNDKNELKVFNDVITKLSVRVEEVEETLKDNKGLIRYKILFDLIFGGGAYTAAEVNESLKVFGDNWVFNYYCLVLTEIDETVLTGLTAEQREYISCKILDIFEGLKNDDYTFANIVLGRNRIVSILNFDSDEHILGDIQMLISKINNELGVNCNIAVSDKTGDINDISEFYEYAQVMLEYKFIYNFGNIFTVEMINSFKNHTHNFDMSLLDNIAALLNSCKTTALKEEVSHIFTRLREGKYELEYLQSILMHLIGIFSRALRNQGVYKFNLDEMDLYKNFNSITTLDECYNWIIELIEAYNGAINIRDSNINKDYMAGIINYICNNIDKEITLNSIAAEFHLNASYLSRSFKESTGINFSEFLLEKKMEKAKELIISNKEMKISEIAESIGYYNTTYFISRFKEKYGITPSKMRKAI